VGVPDVLELGPEQPVPVGLFPGDGEHPQLSAPDTLAHAVQVRGGRMLVCQLLQEGCHGRVVVVSKPEEKRKKNRF
jgi:hypothetical protein